MHCTTQRLLPDIVTAIPYLLQASQTHIVKQTNIQFSLKDLPVRIVPLEHRCIADHPHIYTRMFLRRIVQQASPRRLDAFRFRQCRYNHAMSAEFISIRQNGIPSAQDVQIFMGEASDAYVMIPKDVGNAFLRAASAADASSIRATPERLSLIFYHDSRTFSPSERSILPVHHQIAVEANRNPYLASTPLPRLVLPQNLPRQTASGESSATLHVFPVSNMITLDGTEDGMTVIVALRISC